MLFLPGFGAYEPSIGRETLPRRENGLNLYSPAKPMRYEIYLIRSREGGNGRRSGRSRLNEDGRRMLEPLLQSLNHRGRIKAIDEAMIK